MWIEAEKIKLKRATMDLFDQAAQSLTILIPQILVNRSFSCDNFTGGQTRNGSIDQPTTVVDITYKCNATCKYCQWGNPYNPLRKHLSLKDICLSAQTIDALGTKRVVLSGGEPRLHPKLPQILSYYKKMVNSIIIISNGYGLGRKEIAQLIRHGATGVAVSLDSINPKESILIRETPLNIHRQIISNLKDVGAHHRDFELGINAVVSHVTANWKSVRDLLEFGQTIGVDYVKFQPIFDDSYVRLNAPHLMLTASDFQELLRIGSLLETLRHPLTNPSGFWKNIADLAAGKELSSASCSLGSKHSIAVRHNLSVCYWLDTISFGDTSSALEVKDVRYTEKSFEKAKTKCKVDFHCFCTQELSHIWTNKGRAGDVLR